MSMAIVSAAHMSINMSARDFLEDFSYIVSDFDYTVAPSMAMQLLVDST